MVLFIVSLLACGTANISWGRVLAIRYLITFYSFRYFFYYFFNLFSFFFILFYLLVFLVLRTSVGGTVPRGGLVLVWV